MYGWYFVRLCVCLVCMCFCIICICVCMFGMYVRMYVYVCFGRLVCMCMCVFDRIAQVASRLQLLLFSSEQCIIKVCFLCIYICVCVCLVFCAPVCMFGMYVRLYVYLCFGGWVCMCVCVFLYLLRRRSLLFFSRVRV
jgi:hypothetical protein